MSEETNGNLSENPALIETENEEPNANENKFDIDRAFALLGSKLDDLKEQFGTLDAEFKSKIKYDVHKEKIIDDLHREVQEYKNGLVKNLLRPIIMDIIHTIDDITRLVNTHRKTDPSELDPLKLIKQMADISSDLEAVLFRQGVESFNNREPEFDPKRQKIIETVTAPDESKDKIVSQCIRDGYEWEGNVLRRELVNVYVYKPGSENPQTNKKEENNNE